MPIGGLKEKILAAHRARIPKIIIPEDNKKDLAEIPKNILNDIEIITVKTVDEVLKVALMSKQLKAVEWKEVDTKAIRDTHRTGITSGDTKIKL